MAVFNLLMGGVTGTNEWLNKDDDAATASDVSTNNDDTEYIHENTNSHEVTFTVGNPSLSISGGDIDTIDSVNIYMSATHYGGLGSSLVYVTQTNSAGEDNGSNLISTAGNGTYGVIAAGAETTYDGSNAWTDFKLNDLHVKLDRFRNARPGHQIRISYMYASVTYTPVAVEAADNATFFGANF